MTTRTSLTQLEAQARAGAVRPTSCDVELDLRSAADGDTFASVTRLRFAATVGASTFVDVAPQQLVSAILNGAPLDRASFDPDARRLLLTDLAADNELVVVAVMSYSHDGEGMHRTVDPADGETYLYAMSFLDAAPRWFACFDQPDLKAPVTLDVHCPDTWTVAGNGPARQLGPGHWRLASLGPLATYFTTLVAGPYHSVWSEHDGTRFALHCRRSLAEHLDGAADELFAFTHHSWDELHRLFAHRYPWGEYHQAFVPEFNAGAMENPGCVTVSEDLLFRSRATDTELVQRLVTIAHEMAHMWFGDVVTMQWWDDLWLNESFAEYLGQRVTGDAAWVSFGARRKSWGYAADRRPSTHPVAGNDATDAAAALTAFDGISYAKGASVLRQLAAHLGDEMFLDGLRRHIAAHAHGNATFADLAQAWVDAGACDLDGWLDAWLRTTGTDELAVDGPDVVRSGPQPRAHAVRVAAYDRAGTEISHAEVSVTDARTPHGLAVDAALVLPDAGDDTWAKLVLPPAAWAVMPALLPGVADTRARVAVWNALVLACADAELDPSVALEVVVAALPAETDDAVLLPFGRWARRTLIGTYLDAAACRPASDRLAAAMLDTAGSAAPGSGRQLAAARIAAATTSDDAVLRSWLDGHAPDGLPIDRELRWALVLRLAQLGAIDAAGIAAEAADDSSTQGAVHAARCTAALPDAAAKDAAWSAIMTSAARSNTELYALAEGFWQPAQRELTAPYALRYFDEIDATAALRSGMVVGRLAVPAFPWTAVSHETLDAARGLLAGAVDVAVRRAVVDAADDLRRAVTVRATFGSSRT